jgi:hypothetical protein
VAPFTLAEAPAPVAPMIARVRHRARAADPMILLNLRDEGKTLAPAVR